MTIYNLNTSTPDLGNPEEYWVAPSADIIGKVRLLKDASVWFSAVLRGDNEWITIGERSNVQDGCILHTDMGFPLTIGNDCTIGHKAIVHGATIGNGTLIGMGAIILNGAKIGNNCLVGAGALITEGKEFPDHSMIVGGPAKVIRTLDEAWVAKLKQSALSYVENAKRFRSGLQKSEKM